MTQDVGNRGLELGVGGMTCAACVRRVENGLRKLPRVSEAAVNLATERARVQFADPIQPGDKQLVSDLIRKLGYEPIELTVPGASAQPEHKRVVQNLWLNFLASSVFTIPLLILAMAPMISARVMDYMMAVMPMETWNWLMLCLAAPVQFWFGWQFLRLGIKSLLALSPDMNALVLIGTTAAFAYSTVVTVWPGSVPVESRHVYFEASAVVITLILLGKFLETRSRHQASDAMKSLLNLVPQSAVVVRSGRTEKIPVDQIRVGDVVEVAPGSAIAVDGIVENGQTYIDESMVTGEPIAVFKQAGDRVVAGTLNTNGTIQFRARCSRRGYHLGEDCGVRRFGTGEQAAHTRLGRSRGRLFCSRRLAHCSSHCSWLAVRRARWQAGPGPDSCGSRANHCLPMRDGPGSADEHHGGHRPSRAVGVPVSLQRGRSVAQRGQRHSLRQNGYHHRRQAADARTAHLWRLRRRHSARRVSLDRATLGTSTGFGDCRCRRCPQALIHCHDRPI